MRDELERRLADALDAEGDRARPRPDAWPAIAEGVGARRMPWLLVGSAAAILLVVGLLAVFALQEDDPDTTEVITEPTVESTTTTATPSTTSSSSTSTTTVPAERPVVFAPLDMGPLPPTRSTPPETLIAVRPDGTLVQVETATGRVLTEIANFGDLGDRDEETGMSYGIDGVALSPDGDTVWISQCCEPAAGSMWWTTISGPRTEQRFADSYAPAFGTSSSWATSATLYASVWDVRTSLDVDGHRRDIWATPGSDSGGFHAAVLSPDGAHLAVIWWGTDGRTGRLQIVDPSNTQERSPGFDVIVDESPLVVDGNWAEPVFRRDGALLIAEHAPDIDPSWTPRMVDPISGAISEAEFSYAGSVLVDQDYDPSAEWLLYVVAPSDDTLEGALHWIGPNGETGTVPGSFYAASW